MSLKGGKGYKRDFSDGTGIKPLALHALTSVPFSALQMMPEPYKE